MCEVLCFLLRAVLKHSREECESKRGLCVLGA